jgi:hypothetical protein
MITKPLKTVSILKVFQFLLTFLCVFAPITQTQALFGLFKKKKQPVANNNSRNKRGASDQKRKQTNQKRRKSKNIKKTRNPSNQSKRKKTSIQDKYIKLFDKKLQEQSDENVVKFGKSIGAKLTITPSLEDLRNNSAKALSEYMPSVLPASQFYDYPTSDGATVTVPLKAYPVMPLMDAKTRDFIHNTTQFLEDPKIDPNPKGFIQFLDNTNQLMPKEKKVFKEKLQAFMELHKQYHNPKQCKLNFEESKFGVLIDSAKKIEALVNGIKQNNLQDDLQDCKNSILRELNAIENILGYDQTRAKTEMVQVEKVTYQSPKKLEDHRADQNNAVGKKTTPLFTAPGAA